MRLQDQVCTLEQAKRLKELGVVAPSLHTWGLLKFPANENGDFAKRRAKCLRTDTGDNLDRFIMHFIDDETAQYHWSEGTHDGGYDHSRCELDGEDYHAYSVAELGVILQDMPMINQHGKFEIKAHKSVFPFPQIKEGFEWFVVRGDTEAEARAAMLIYLLEQGLISADEVNTRLK